MKTNDIPVEIAHLPVREDRPYPFKKLQRVGTGYLALLGSDSANGDNAVICRLWDIANATPEQQKEIAQYWHSITRPN